MSGRKERTARGWTIIDGALLAASLVILGLLCRPEGPIGRRWMDWRTSRESTAIVREHWSSLVSGSTALGNRDSETVLVAFLDYECPYCRLAHSAIEEFLAGFPEARVVVRHLPLSQLHPMAEDAALAALCAGGLGWFPAVHEYLMEESEWRDTEGEFEIGLGLGLGDDPRFRMCLEQEDSRDLLDQDIALARSLRLSGTPAFITWSGVHRGGPVTPALLASLAGLAR